MTIQWDTFGGTDLAANKCFKEAKAIKFRNRDDANGDIQCGVEFAVVSPITTLQAVWDQYEFVPFNTTKLSAGVWLNSSSGTITGEMTITLAGTLVATDSFSVTTAGLLKEVTLSNIDQNADEIRGTLQSFKIEIEKLTGAGNLSAQGFYSQSRWRVL